MTKEWQVEGCQVACVELWLRARFLQIPLHILTHHLPATVHLIGCLAPVFLICKHDQHLLPWVHYGLNDQVPGKDLRPLYTEGVTTKMNKSKTKWKVSAASTSWHNYKHWENVLYPEVCKHMRDFLLQLLLGRIMNWIDDRYWN